MSSTEVTVNNLAYTVGKLDAMRQFHVQRRLMPMVMAMGLSSEKVKSALEETKEAAILQFILGPASQILATMSNEDVEYVIQTCLSVVRRNAAPAGTPPAWAQVMVNGSMMFPDIDAPVMMRLVFEVLRSNMRDFFVQGLGVESSTQASDPQAQPQ